MLLGGNHHDFDGFAAAMTPLLEESGYRVTATADLDSLKPLSEVDVLVQYTSLGGSVKDGRHAPDPDAGQVAALVEWVRAGGGLLSAHCATVIEETNLPLRRLHGGRFLEHPPQFTFTVYPLSRPHPITEGVEAFTVYDELYKQAVEPDATIHMVALDRGVAHPMVWTRTEGRGRVAHVAPGHGPRVWGLEAYRRLMRQALSWVTP